MIYAIYNEKTKEFKNVEEGSINQLETEKQGKPVYLIPANSTEIIPEMKEGYANVWNGNSWDLLEDNRGVEYWLSTDNYMSKPHTMENLGSLPKNSTLSAPEMTVPEKIDYQSKEKRIERNRLLNDIIWRIERYNQQTYLKVQTTDSAEIYAQILNYVEYLRNIPQSSKFPNIDIMTFDEWRFN